MYGKLAVALLAAVVGSGCIRSATLITVKPDGSGTIEQSVLMNATALKGMLGGLGAPDQTSSSSPINEAELRKTADRLGEGVTFVSSEPVKTPDGFEGAVARYAFTDISKVRVQQDPNLAGAAPGGLSTPPKEEHPVTFAMDRSGGLSTLTVTFNDKAATEKAQANTPPGGPAMENPQMLEMMRNMFKGFKVGIDLQVDGTIVKTNADHVAGSRVTLLEMDLEALLADEARLKEVQKAVGPNASVAELKPYLKDMKGLKINDPVVTVQFR